MLNQPIFLELNADEKNHFDKNHNPKSKAVKHVRFEDIEAQSGHGLLEAANEQDKGEQEKKWVTLVDVFNKAQADDQPAR